MLNDLNH